jgi:hypothetical protein
MVDYNINAAPLLTDYNHSNDGVSPTINIDGLNNLRGSGLYNPAPNYIQTTDRGHAWSNINNSNIISSEMYESKKGDLYTNPSGAVDVEGTWETNTNYNIKPISGDNYEYYDEYQRWALNAIRISDPYILPFLFSKINVHFIQDSVKDYVKKYRNITINTRQDTDNLLNLMLNTYTLFNKSGGVYQNNDCSTNTSQNDSTRFSSVLGNLNKNIIEIYVDNVLSGLNMYEYYIKDKSTLPSPLTNPVLISNKGKNVLGFEGFFSDNHEFTRSINSFNIRDVIPDKINNTMFGN